MSKFRSNLFPFSRSPRSTTYDGRRSSRRRRTLAALIAPLLVVASLSVGASPAYAVSATTAQQQILKDTNAARQKAGARPLVSNPSLNAVAMAWSRKQAATDRMSHNPKVGSEIPAGWRSWGENVAYGYSHTGVTAAWMNSPGHRANILNKGFTDIGIGYAEKNGRGYYTQVFATYQAPKAPRSVAGKAVGTKSVRATWAAPSGGGPVATYTAILVTAKGTKIQTRTTTARTTDFTGLSPKTTYNIRVYASNGGGRSPVAAGKGRTG